MKATHYEDYIERRAREVGNYIVTDQVTIRKAAEKFNVSKSTVYNDVNFRLRKIDKKLWLKVREVLDKNLAERAERGGNALKEYKRKK